MNAIKKQTDIFFFQQIINIVKLLCYVEILIGKESNQKQIP